MHTLIVYIWPFCFAFAFLRHCWDIHLVPRWLCLQVCLQGPPDGCGGATPAEGPGDANQVQGLDQEDCHLQEQTGSKNTLLPSHYHSAISLFLDYCTEDLLHSLFVNFATTKCFFFRRQKVTSQRESSSLLESFLLRLSVYLQVALPGKLLVYELVADSNQNPTTATTTTSPVSFSSTAPTSPVSQREAGGEGGGGGQYRIVHKLINDVECSLLVVCDHHIVLCQERRLICLSLQGDRERYTTILWTNVVLLVSLIGNIMLEESLKLYIKEQ